MNVRNKEEVQQASHRVLPQEDTSLQLFHDLISTKPQAPNTQPIHKKTSPHKHAKTPLPLTIQNQ